MPEEPKNLDGIKPLSKDQVAARRKAVLEAIGEGGQPPVNLKADDKTKGASRSVAGEIKPIKADSSKGSKPPIEKGVDLLHPADGNFIRETRSGWRGELTKLIGHADETPRSTATVKAPVSALTAAKPKEGGMPEEPTNTDPVEKPAPLPSQAVFAVERTVSGDYPSESTGSAASEPETKSPLLTLPKPEAKPEPVKDGKKEATPDKVVLRPLSELRKPAVSEVNPFGNRITQMRIEQRKKSAAKNTASTRKHKNPAVTDRVSIGGLASRAAAILALTLAIIAFAYALFAVLVVKLSVDSPFTRAIARYLPVPAAFTQDGILDYYTYRDLSERLSAVNADPAAVRSAVIRQLLIDGLMLRYGLEADDEAQAVDMINSRIVQDETVNQVGINRVNKIADMVGRGDDFVKVAGKYSDEQGQATVEIPAIDSYSYAEAVRDIKSGETSDVVYGADGYYIYHCFERTESQIQLGFLFVRAKLLSSYLDEAVPNYSFWSLVE